MTISTEDKENAIKLNNTIQKRNDAIDLIFEQNKIFLDNSIFGEKVLKLKYYKLYLKYFNNRFMLEAAIAAAEIIEIYIKIYIKIIKFSGEIKTYDDYLKNCFNLKNKTQNIDLLDIIHNLNIIEFLKIYDIVDTTTKIMKENKFYTFINISNNTTCFLKNFKFENSQNTTKAILEYYKKIILLTQSKIQEELKQQKLLSEQKTQLLTIVTTRNWSYFNTSFEKITFQVACFNFHKEYGFYPLDNQKYWIFDYTNNKSLWVKGFDEINENYIEYYERINNSCEKLLIEAERIAKGWSGKSKFNSNILIVDKPNPKII